MDYYKLPVGFSMALAVNQTALNAYAAMTPEQKQAILDRAHKAKSQTEMHQIVSSLSERSV